MLRSLTFPVPYSTRPTSISGIPYPASVTSLLDIHGPQPVLLHLNVFIKFIRICVFTIYFPLFARHSWTQTSFTLFKLIHKINQDMIFQYICVSRNFQMGCLLQQWIYFYIFYLYFPGSYKT